MEPANNVGETLPESARLRSFHLGGDRSITPVRMSAGESPADKEDIALWVDVEGVPREQLGSLLTGYGLHPIHLSAFGEAGHISRLIPADGGIFLEFSVMLEWNNPNLGRISLFHSQNLLITAHRHPIPGLEQVVNQLGVGRADWARSTSTLLYHLLDHLLNRSFELLMQARERIIELNDNFEDDPQAFHEQDIHGTRRRINRLAISCEDQYYVISALKAMDLEDVDLILPKEYLHDLLGHAQYANRYADRLDKRAKELKFLTQMNLQTRSESRLRAMTIIMAIFTPLTFLAGIYGMNFANMPELTWDYGYFAVLAAMAVTAVMLLIFFWRKGWFS